MSEKELREYIGNKIKEFRIKKKLTQSELGEKIGVRNNTISAYERGVIAPGQDMLFSLSQILDVKVNDFFPVDRVKEPSAEYLVQALNLSNANLEAKDILFLNELIKKTLSLEGEERAKFLESINFTVEYYKKMNGN